jgi:hypothetical protein
LLQTAVSTDVLRFLDDAHHFTRENTYIANQAPLQLYASALIFAPESSLIKSCFKSCMPLWLTHPPEVAKAWNHDLLTLDGHASNITAMAFSPDDQYLASCAEDGMLRVCDAVTGECISTFSVRQSGETPSAIALSPRNNRIAVAYVDNSFYKRTREFFVTVFEFEDGTVVQTINRKHTGRPWQSNTTDVVVIVDGLQIRLVFRSEDTLSVATTESFMLEVWRMELHSDNLERVWWTDTRPESFGFPGPYQSLALSTNASLLLSSICGEGRISSWHLDSGTPASTYSITEHTSGFLALHGKDIIFETRREYKQTLKRISTQDDPVDVFFASGTDIFAIAHSNDKFAHTSEHTHATGGIQISILPKTPTSQDKKHPRSNLQGVRLTRDGERIILDCWDHLELRDVQGNNWLTSPTIENHFSRVFKVPSTSKDGSVIAMKVEGETLVWYVGSERFQRLPDIRSGMLGWPVILNNGKSIVFLFDERLVVWDLEKNQGIRSIDRVGRHIRYTIFSDDDKTLHKSGGTFDLEPGHRDVRYITPRQWHRRSEPIGLSHGLDWVQFRNEELLWLPNHYRPSDYTWAMNTVAIAQRHNGRVVVMKIVDPRDLSVPAATALGRS